MHGGISRLYASGKFTTEQIAKQYSISTRQVQRIAKKTGVVRTQAEANRTIAPLKKYKKIPKEYRVKRKHLTQKQRYLILSKQGYCTVCGMTPAQGIRLNVDHIDENPENNDPSNLQVLCNNCNQGKSHAHRFGED